MILLFTDFSHAGPYVGQMHVVLAAQAPSVPVIDLMHDAAAFNSRAASYLLASLAQRVPETAVCVAVVDPGVGSARRPLAIEADNRWFVGPDNGLFSVLPHVFQHLSCHEIVWRPESLSASFHGRDLFAPVAAALATGQAAGMLQSIETIPVSAAEIAEIIYIDGYGNAITGLRAVNMSPRARLHVQGQKFIAGRTFTDHPPGTALWYCNSNGLVELSINQGNAADTLALSIGDQVIQDL